MSETEVRAQLRSWILERAGAEDQADLRDDFPLLEEGLLSSLDVVELILFIESLTGEEVDVSVLEPESFSSIDTVYRTFFGAGASKVTT